MDEVLVHLGRRPDEAGVRQPLVKSRGGDDESEPPSAALMITTAAAVVTGNTGFALVRCVMNAWALPEDSLLTSNTWARERLRWLAPLHALALSSSSPSRACSSGSARARRSTRRSCPRRRASTTRGGTTSSSSRRWRSRSRTSSTRSRTTRPRSRCGCARVVAHADVRLHVGRPLRAARADAEAATRDLGLARRTVRRRAVHVPRADSARLARRRRGVGG